MPAHPERSRGTVEFAGPSLDCARDERFDQSGQTTEVEAADAGFTLIEVVVALGLFALIALAGVALVDTVLEVEARTDGQLERLADIERTLFVVTADFEALDDAPLVGGAASVGFDRHGGGGAIAVRYGLAGGTLRRTQNGRRQALLDGVAAARWSYFGAGGWQDRWPATQAQARTWPLAVALDLTLAPRGGGLRGSVRRVVDLPVRPLPPGAVGV